MDKKYRYELKFIINNAEAAMLKKQLLCICKKDAHSKAFDYSYYIKSLYFDDIFDSGFYDKINGVQYRKKYRIRIYNNNTKIIKFECKHKDNDMTYKQDTTIDLKTAQYLIKGEYYNINTSDELLNQFLVDARLFGLKPTVTVNYKRLALTYPVSNVRITFDEDIASGIGSPEMFFSAVPEIRVSNNNYVLMEVKCDEFIPSHITAILNSVDKCRVAVSKFALSTEVK